MYVYILYIYTHKLICIDMCRVYVYVFVYACLDMGIDRAREG